MWTPSLPCKRGATSDLAAPSEIARLVQGKPAHADHDAETLAARELFQAASEQDRKVMIDVETKAAFRHRGYRLLHEAEGKQLRPSGWFKELPMFYKQIGGVACVVGSLPCVSSLLQVELEKLTWMGFFWRKLADWRELPTRITQLSRRKVKAVRRMWLFPVLRNVPEGRIRAVFTRARKLGNAPHYYWPSLADEGYLISAWYQRMGAGQESSEPRGARRIG
jgi:hypothetical protein